MALLGPVWKMPVGGGPETKVLGGVPNRSFTLGKNAIYYITHVSGRSYELRRVPYDGGSYEVPGTTENVELGFALSPDERWIAYTTFDSSRSDLMLVENFR